MTVGHVEVEDGQLELRIAVQDVERSIVGPGGMAGRSRAVEQPGDQEPEPRVVVDVQDPPAPDAAAIGRRPARRVRLSRACPSHPTAGSRPTAREDILGSR